MCYSITITNDISQTYYKSSEEIEAFKIFEYYKGKNPNAPPKDKKLKKKKKEKESNNGKNKKKSGSVKKINLEGTSDIEVNNP